MEYRLGTALKIKDSGETLSLACPKCGDKVNFHVFSNAETRLDASFPFMNMGKVYFLICPKCAGIFTVEQSKGKSFDKGLKTSILDLDLKTLKEFKE